MGGNESHEFLPSYYYSINYIRRAQATFVFYSFNLLSTLTRFRLFSINLYAKELENDPITVMDEMHSR